MTVSDQVRKYLYEHEKARNSDKYLIALFLRDSDLGLTKDQIQKLVNFPSFESIRRTRQKIQEKEIKLKKDGKPYDNNLLATDKIQKERNRREQEMRQNMPSAKPERVEQILSDGSTVSLPSGYSIVE